jgi:ribosomal protein S18 acetylase RimI-like enzyme
MDVEYFNFQTEFAVSRSQRRAFLQRWWSLGRDDPGWTPPRYAEIRQHLVDARHAHVARLHKVFLSQEAVRRPRGRTSWDLQSWVDSSGIGGASLGITTAAAGIFLDKRFEPEAAYLFLPHIINHSGCAESLFDALASACSELGVSRLIGPSSFSPYLESGLQLNYWHQTAPALAVSNPPYLPELLAQFMQPVEPILRHWRLPIPIQFAVSSAPTGLKFETLEHSRLAGDLLPLMIAACESTPGFPAPDPPEADFLLSCLPPAVHAWQATLAGEPVGFILLGPEISPVLHDWRGGRSLVARLLLPLALSRSFQHGRIYFAGVLPGFRRQGIGNQMLRQAIQAAQALGWRSLVFGPLADGSAGAALLSGAGAQMRTAYRFFNLEW